MFILRNIPKEEYYSKELDDAVKNFLNKFFHTKTKEKVGLGKSSCGYTYEFAKIEEFQKLSQLISIKLLDTKYLFEKKDVDFILYTSAWINEIEFGCSGKIHIHDEKNLEQIDAVAIFYYKIPEKSSNFIIIDEKYFDKKNLDVSDYDFHEKSSIKVNEGDLIIHAPKVLHGVSEHQSNDSRICFVFNFKFAKKNV